MCDAWRIVPLEIGLNLFREFIIRFRWSFYQLQDRACIVHRHSCRYRKYED